VGHEAGFVTSEPAETRNGRILLQSLIVKLRLCHQQLHASQIPTCDALLEAGYDTATSALRLEPLRSLWSGGDSGKANRIAKVFTLAMVSRFLSLPRDGRPESIGAPDRERRDWIAFILRIFGDTSDDSFDYYLRIDQQHQMDHTSEHRRIQSLADVLFFCQAMVALGAENAARLDLSDLPLADYNLPSLAERGLQVLTSGVHEQLVELITSKFYSTVLPRLE
jgi:hypothetical protein